MKYRAARDGKALRCFVSSSQIRLPDTIGVMVPDSQRFIPITKVLRNQGALGLKIGRQKTVRNDEKFWKHMLLEAKSLAALPSLRLLGLLCHSPTRRPLELPALGQKILANPYRSQGRPLGRTRPHSVKSSWSHNRRQKTLVWKLPAPAAELQAEPPPEDWRWPQNQ